jgi:solute carrier family 25 2-oxodicarboxylate transporter 21
MHPLDVVKTRFQLQTKSFKAAAGSDPHVYTGVVDCFRKIIGNEGFFALWKGLLPPILVETPKRAIKVSSADLLAQTGE